MTAQLLAVDREMLRAGGDAVGLNAANQTGCHTTGHDRVFGIVLKIAAAQRVALDVHARPEQHVHVEIVGFLAERLAHLLGERRIPRIGDRAGRGEAGCGLGRAEAQMIAFAELAAHTVGAVAHHKAGDAGLLVAAGIPFRAAREHRGFLGDRQFFKFHIVLPCTVVRLSDESVAPRRRHRVCAVPTRRSARLGRGRCGSPRTHDSSLV